MYLRDQPARTYTKEQQVAKTRITPLARQRGAISTKVRKQLHDRSGGLCERDGCRHKAVHAAHIERRWKLQKTTVDDLLHLCLGCHYWADNTGSGREWLKSKRDQVG